MQLDDTLASHFEVLYRPHRLAQKSEETVRIHRVCLRRFSKFLGRPATLSDLNDDDVRAAMSWMVENGRAIPTANNLRCHLVALWTFLARKQIVSTWPDVLEFTEPERSPIAWMPDQLPRLWAACDAVPGRISGIPANLWWHSLHAIAWDSGERISAIMGLRWTDVDEGSGWARFPAEIRKGRRADLRCRLHRDTLHALSLMPRPKELVLPWDRFRSHLWLRYRQVRQAAGLPTDRAHAFHCLRRSVASYFEAAGGDATKLLGHSSRRVTEKYLDPRVVQQQHACDVLFRPDQPQPTG